jgi:RHS repeat-associated protein
MVTRFGILTAPPYSNQAANERPVRKDPFMLSLRFLGQYYDKETNLHYNYQRDYDPALGRYVQSDPIGLQGGINTYGYVLQNPISYKDPKGLLVVVDDAVIIGGVIITSACIATPACRKAV